VSGLWNAFGNFNDDDIFEPSGQVLQKEHSEVSKTTNQTAGEGLEQSGGGVWGDAEFGNRVNVSIPAYRGLAVRSLRMS